MRRQQLTLLDKQSISEIKQSSYVVIQVKQIEDTGVQNQTKMASVCLKPNELKVKDEIFMDYFGNKYIGCKCLRDIRYSESGEQIHVYKSGMKIQDYFLKQIKPIRKLIDEKRRIYYAN